MKQMIHVLLLKRNSRGLGIKTVLGLFTLFILLSCGNDSNSVVSEDDTYSDDTYWDDSTDNNNDNTTSDPDAYNVFTFKSTPTTDVAIDAAREAFSGTMHVRNLTVRHRDVEIIIDHIEIEYDFVPITPVSDTGNQFFPAEHTVRMRWESSSESDYLSSLEFRSKVFYPDGSWTGYYYTTRFIKLTGIEEEGRWGYAITNKTEGNLNFHKDPANEADDISEEDRINLFAQGFYIDETELISVNGLWADFVGGEYNTDGIDPFADQVDSGNSDSTDQTDENNTETNNSSTTDRLSDDGDVLYDLGTTTDIVINTSDTNSMVIDGITSVENIRVIADGANAISYQLYMKYSFDTYWYDFQDRLIPRQELDIKWTSSTYTDQIPFSIEIRSKVFTSDDTWTGFYHFYSFGARVNIGDAGSYQGSYSYSEEWHRLFVRDTISYSTDFASEEEVRDIFTQGFYLAESHISEFLK